MPDQDDVVDVELVASGQPETNPGENEPEGPITAFNAEEPEGPITAFNAEEPEGPITAFNAEEPEGPPITAFNAQ